jgi:hypothetical protein
MALHKALPLADFILETGVNLSSTNPQHITLTYIGDYGVTRSAYNSLHLGGDNWAVSFESFSGGQIEGADDISMQLYDLNWEFVVKYNEWNFGSNSIDRFYIIAKNGSILMELEVPHKFDDAKWHTNVIHFSRRDQLLQVFQSGVLLAFVQVPSTSLPDTDSANIAFSSFIGEQSNNHRFRNVKVYPSIKSISAFNQNGVILSDIKKALEGGYKNQPEPTDVSLNSLYDFHPTSTGPIFLNALSAIRVPGCLVTKYAISQNNYANGNMWYTRVREIMKPINVDPNTRSVISQLNNFQISGYNINDDVVHVFRTFLRIQEPGTYRLGINARSYFQLYINEFDTSQSAQSAYGQVNSDSPSANPYNPVEVELKTGFHDITILFLQDGASGGVNDKLTLSWRPPNETNYVAIPSNYLAIPEWLTNGINESLSIRNNRFSTI